MAIADDDIERLRSTVSIVDVVAQFVALRKVGRNWVGLCPFHAEKTPSFNVREETGRYKCFGCDKSGDVFTFVQEHEHVDFVGAVEHLAAKAGITLTYTSTGQSRERARRKQLVDAMATAVQWYHERLLQDPEARLARDYLRSRGLSGDVARAFLLGWAPDDWDALSTRSGIEPERLSATGLAFTNRRDRLQDALRGRVLFPIFNESGEAVAIGGRVLPGSTDPAKYKNSPETPIYAKSKTLYGLNWAKTDVVARGQAVVCEGYTDVIGFHRAGVTTAVATCGTAFTEDHVRLLKRYASRVVLAFDADAAGQGAAERFYEWERKHDMQVAVARLPGGMDPGELAQRDPAALGCRRRGGRPVPAVPAAPGVRRVADAEPGGPRPSGRAGDGRRPGAPGSQRAAAVHRRGGIAGRPDAGRPRARGPWSASGAGGTRAAAPSPADGERRVRGHRVAGPGLGVDRRVAGRGAVRRRVAPQGVPRACRR